MEYRTALKHVQAIARIERSTYKTRVLAEKAMARMRTHLQGAGATAVLHGQEGHYRVQTSRLVTPFQYPGVEDYVPPRRNPRRSASHKRKK